MVTAVLAVFLSAAAGQGLIAIVFANNYYDYYKYKKYDSVAEALI